MAFARKIRLLLVDDHELVRHGLVVFLNGQEGYEVVGEASTGREAIELAEELRPDIVIMDVTMPEMGGVEATRRIRERLPSTRVIALSMHRDSVYVREILRAGADGYLLKESRSNDMLAAIQAVSNGEGYISPAVSQAVLEDYRKQAKAPIDLLTARERDVLQLVAEGFTNKQIAQKLNLSVYTAEGYRGRIMEKLNLHSTGELVRFAMRSGLID
ncbi:MAG: response regulator [Acidobacteria bacterium]|nr:response regulator [Acidobacteriota bacterium]